MGRQRFPWAFLLIGLAISGCAVTTPYNPFKVPQEQIKSKVKVVALAPINFPGDMEDTEPLKAKFEFLIEAKLRQAGFMVVPSREYDAVWKQTIEKLGGVFDPLTGKRDEAKFKTVREHTLRELATRTKADALLEHGIGVFKANFAGHLAQWHGTSESVVTAGFWGAFFAGGAQGTVPALSLVVALSDIHGVEMYVNVGGIQVLAKLSGQNFVTVQRYELFVDQERNRQAVNIALDPLAGKTMPQDASAAPAKGTGQ